MWRVRTELKIDAIEDQEERKSFQEKCREKSSIMKVDWTINCSIIIQSYWIILESNEWILGESKKYWSFQKIQIIHIQ